MTEERGDASLLMYLLTGGGAFGDKNTSKPITSTAVCLCVPAHETTVRTHMFKGIRDVRVCSYVLLPGISLTVVLPGYNVFKQLSSCHPGRGEGRQGGMKERREGGGKERHRETDRRGKREKLLAYTNQPQSHAWMKCQCVCVCVYRIYSQVKD